MVGYFKIYLRGEGDGVYKVILEGTVRPERRGQGIGSRLVGPMLDRALEGHREKRSELPLKVMLLGKFVPPETTTVVAMPVSSKRMKASRAWSSSWR